MHLRESRRKCLWMMSFLRKPPHGRNILLLHSGDVERNPGPREIARKMKKTQLTIVHVNTRSLPRYFDDVATLVSSHRPDILALSETWLDSSIDDKEISLPGFVLFRSDRNHCGGGVAIYCADHLRCSLISSGPTTSAAEFLWASVTSPHSSFALGCFYRPPSASSQSVDSICNNIESMLLSKKNPIACGDFNIDLSNTNKPFAKKFQNFLTSRLLHQSISEPTHFSDASNAILDLLISSSDLQIAKSLVLQSFFFDHLPILLQLKLLVLKPPPTLVIEILRHARSIRISFNFGQITHVTIFINNHSIVQRFANLGFFRYTQLNK